ncbi:MAG: hypothetical protein Salg2KO_01290 [Salibacteraceae bacterium]
MAHRFTLILTLLSFFSNALNAQNAAFDWAKEINTNSVSVPVGIETDTDGNIYSVGWYNGTADFDPNAGVNNVSTGGRNTYITKWDSAGNFIWQKQFGNPNQVVVTDFHMDKNGALFLTGLFVGNIDWDPGVGTTYIAHTVNWNTFIVKLDSSGSLVWAKTLSNAYNEGNTILTNDSGEVIVMGSYAGNIDLDPGVGTVYSSSGGGGGFFNQRDLYVLKLDESGNYISSVTWNTPLIYGVDAIVYRNHEMAVSSKTGAVFITGQFVANRDFDPGSGSFNMTPISGGYDVFVLKLDSAFEFQWAKQLNVESRLSMAIACDSLDRVYASGMGAYGFTDFDPGAGVYNLPGGNRVPFIWRLDSTGAFDWAGQLEHVSNYSLSSLYLDKKGNLYSLFLYGGIGNPAVRDVDYSHKVQLGSVPTGRSTMLIKMDANMEHVWSKPVASIAGDPSVSYGDIEIDELGNVYSTGLFLSNSDFDPGPGSFIMNGSGGYGDIFVHKMEPSCLEYESTEFHLVCDSLTWGNGTTYTESTDTTVAMYTTAGDTCDSIVNLKLVVRSMDNQAVISSADSICFPDAWNITVTGSEVDAEYYLRLDANDSVIAGPLVGDGDSLTFTLDSLTQNNSYHVYGEAPQRPSAVALPLNNDYITFKDPFYEYDKEITVEAWVNYNGSWPWGGQSTPQINGQASSVWLWHQNTFYVNDGGTWRSLGMGTMPSGWAHIAFVANATGMYIYINGALHASTSVGISTNMIVNNGSEIRLGTDPRFYPSYRNSSVAWDNFMVWNTARTQAQIQADMNNCLTGNETGLVHYAKMNAGEGNFVENTQGYFGEIIEPSSNNWVEGSGICEMICTRVMDDKPSVVVNYPDTTIQVDTACDAFMWVANNVTYTTSGIYHDTLVNVNGCDSYATLDLTVYYSDTTSQTDTACNAFTWVANNVTYTSTGVYYDTLTNVHGCDSFVSLDLTVHYSDTVPQTDTACNAFTWAANNFTYTSSGTYYDTLVNVNGCDSFVSLDLTIYYSDTTNQTDTACNSFTWIANNVSYTTTGVYYDTLMNVNGCDSFVSLDLTIFYSDTSIQIDTVCDEFIWEANNQVYTATGVYHDTLTNINGCDSFVTLDLTVNYTDVDSQAAVACDTYTWITNNQTYTTSGTYIDTLVNAQGCDSIVILDLTVNYSDSATQSVTSCFSYVWDVNSMQYNESGMYISTITTSKGCDSTITLDLTINDVDTAISKNGLTLTANAGSASYQWLKCEDGYTEIPGATNQSYTVLENGEYAVEVTQNNCIDTTR